MNNPNTHTFTYCPGCGEQQLEPSCIKSFACRACGFVFYINCAAAAIGLIFDAQGRLLITRRQFDPGKGRLDLPGGFAQPHEGIEQALVREIKEELNLEVTSTAYYASFANTYVYKKVVYPITDMAFVCQVNDLSPIRAGDDVAEFIFTPIGELDPRDFVMTSVKKTIARLSTHGYPGYPPVLASGYSRSFRH